MNKVDLITRVAELEATLKANESAQTKLTSDLLEAQKQLENINKPKITSEQADLIYEAIEIAAESYRFDDPDQYEVDFSINYDSRLCVENIEFKEYSELTNEIYQQVEKLFNVTTEEKND